MLALRSPRKWLSIGFKRGSARAQKPMMAGARFPCGTQQDDFVCAKGEKPQFWVDHFHVQEIISSRSAERSLMQSSPRPSRASSNSELSRRNVLRSSVAGGVALALLSRRALAQDIPQDFDKALFKFTPELVESVREYHDQDFIPPELGLERQPIRARKSETEISPKAVQLIIACEVSSAAAYKNSYQRPTWPKGNSGITIGIGYDIGYVDPFSLEQDWAAYTSAENIKILSQCCDQKGQNAERILSNVQGVVIDYPHAESEFLNNEKKRYVGLTESSLPNTSALLPDSLGALVSLVYNRGASFGVPPEKDPAGRYTEMRAIKVHMANRDWSKIPDEIRGMKRIWQGQGLDGLIIRRELEARLFEQGMPAK
jgi:GH24 family phage-related lysozyme (muramidase)